MSKKVSVFKPFPLFTGAHSQTICALFLTFYSEPKGVTRFVHLNDGEKIAMEISTPPDWKEDDQTVVMIHGFCGSHKSPYIVRMSHKLYQEGVRTIRINLRGCGTGRGHAKRIYQPDSSNDIWKALQEIKRDTPYSKLIVIGYSLGGNILLKMVGDWGNEAKKIIEKVIAVNPPIDMQLSVILLSKNRVYDRFFMSYLKSDIEFIHETFNNMPPIHIPTTMTLLEFNELYTAPESGYSSARDYYHACSAGRLISSISVKSHILFSRDDPIVNCNVLDSVKIPDNIDILVTENGGHLGYLGMPGQKGGFYWMDSVLTKWIFENRE